MGYVAAQQGRLVTADAAEKQDMWEGAVQVAAAQLPLHKSEIVQLSARCVDCFQGSIAILKNATIT